MSPQLCSCDGPPHPYDPAWCGGGRKAPDQQRSAGRVPDSGECLLTADPSGATTTSAVDITIAIDGHRYSLRVAGDTTDALLATNVGRAVSVAIIEHGAVTGGRC